MSRRKGKDALSELSGGQQRWLFRAGGGTVAVVLAAAFYMGFGPIGVAAVVALGLFAMVSLEAYRQRALPAQRRPATRTSFWLGMFLPAGLILLLVGEQVIGATADDVWAWRSIAGVLIGAAVAFRIRELANATSKKRVVEGALAAAVGGVVLSIVLYALSTDAGVELMGLEDSAAERASGALSALWPAVLLSSWAAFFFMELAYRRMPVEESIEVRRVLGAGAHGLGLALSLVFVVSINYIATEREWRTDLSYLKTTRPSETTLARAHALDEPVHVYLLYPRVNDVLERLRPYFEELDAASDELTVEVRDHALASELVTQHRVRGNGFVLLVRGEGETAQAQSFEVGTELEAARSRLRSLDGTFQQHFAQLTIRPRALHLTAGHRERSGSGADGDTPDMRISELATILSQNNIESPQLGLAQGLANRVPEGTRAVAVIGPRDPFLPEEAESLLRYVREGGRVFMFLDPDVNHGLDPFLAGIGVRMRDGVLNHERLHLRRGPPPADKQVVFTNHFSAHPTVTLVNRYRSQGVACVLDGGGALVGTETTPEGVSVTFPMRTDAGFWLDQNGNHEQDEGEPAEPRFNTMAAVTVANPGGDEGRVVLVADGDFITDAWMPGHAPRGVGNILILLDSVNWLVGEEHVLGPTESEEDIPIQHTQEGDKALFWGTSFGVPLPLILMGVWLMNRRRRGLAVERDDEVDDGDPPPKPKKATPAAEPDEDAEASDVEDGAASSASAPSKEEE